GPYPENAESAARMVAGVQLFHALARDVCIDLCSRDVAVAEKQLHDAQVRTVVEQVRRERVPDRVRRQLLLDAGFARVALDDVPEGLARHAVAAARREQVFGLPLEQDLDAGTVDEFFDPVLRLVAERNEPLAIALADDAEHTLIQVDLIDLEIDELGDTHAGGVQHLEHRAIAVAERLRDDGRREQGFDLFLGQRLRQRAADLRHRDLRRRVLAEQAFAQQVAIEAAEARELPRRRARLRAGFDAPRDVIEDVGAARTGELDVAGLQALVQREQIGAIRAERVLRKPALHPDRIEKAIDERLGIAR